MRIVILSSGLYSETACAMAVQMSKMGRVPAGGLALSTLNGGTVRRKLGQWGVREVARYASNKLLSRGGHGEAEVKNHYLRPLLERERGFFRSLREVGAVYAFPVAVCHDQNSPKSIARLKEWSPDLVIFTGGNILRKELLELPRLGVLNVHLGLLPEIRGMSSPEWSLLKQVPVGITIHSMDCGIDTGPILQTFEFPDVARCESLSDLRNRLIAFGIEKTAEVVARLEKGEISATLQPDVDKGNQFFVMHEWLQARAAERLPAGRRVHVAGAVRG